MMINKPCFSFENNKKKWEAVSLGNVLKINSGRDYKHLNVGDIPVYGTGGYMLSVDQSLSKENAIGIGRKGTIDRPQLLYAPFWTVDTLFFMTPQKNNDLYFLYTYMQKINWKSYDESSGVPSLSKLNIEKIDMFVPNGEEQIQIGSFFKGLDDLIFLHQQELEALKQTKKGFLQKMFPKQGESEPQLRFSGFKEKWNEKKLIEIVDFFNNSRVPIEAENRIKGNYAYYGASGIIDYVENYIFDGEYVLLAEDGANIIMRSSPIAYITQGKFWVNNHAHVMRMKTGSNFFLLQQLERQNYKKFNSGTAQPKLNAKIVHNINISIPAENEQIKIGEFFRQLDEVIELKEKELEAVKETKNGFLQKMFV